MSVLVKFTCTDCDKDVFIVADRVRLTFAADGSDAVVITATCHLGHTRDKQFSLTEHGQLIQTLLDGGVQTPAADDVQSSIDALADAPAWLDSDAFDTDRAALRLTGGPA